MYQHKRQKYKFLTLRVRTTLFLLKTPMVGLAFVVIKIYNRDPPRDMAEPVRNSATAKATGKPLLAHGDQASCWSWTYQEHQALRIMKTHNLEVDNCKHWQDPRSENSCLLLYTSTVICVIQIDCGVSHDADHWLRTVKKQFTCIIPVPVPVTLIPDTTNISTIYGEIQIDHINMQ